MGGNSFGGWWSSLGQEPIWGWGVFGWVLEAHPEWGAYRDKG